MIRRMRSQQVANRGSDTSAGVRKFLESERALAAAIELIFGLFLLSGMGFVYRGQRAVGWMALLLRVAALFGGAVAVGKVSPMHGFLAGLALWALPPVGLAFIVASSWRRPWPMSEHGGLAEASLEGLGLFGFSGVGWIASGRWDIGFPILVARFLTLGAGGWSLLYWVLDLPDGSGYPLEGSAALAPALILSLVMLVALWLACPISSAALLRRAQRLATHQEKRAII